MSVGKRLVIFYEGDAHAEGSQMVTFFSGPFLQSGKLPWASTPVVRSNNDKGRGEINMMSTV